ncbi:MAG: nucleotidyl transferase AbiEii/AbiGii toxin family protein [Desulfococcaceae bacterium]
MTMKLHTDILPSEQKRLMDVLSREDWIRSFYLAGGTSLALRIGHRQSVDFDFFTPEGFENLYVIERVSEIGSFELFNQASNTVNGLLNEVRISFFKYKYPLLGDPLYYGNLRIADLTDIALMKLEAISGRGGKKDFIDLFFLLRYFSFEEIFNEYPKKYGIEIGNHYHLLKSLAYFEDAESEPMPKMFENVSWEKIKSHLKSELKRVGVS